MTSAYHSAQKSVLPFVAAYQIVEFLDPPGAAKRSGRELARQLGHAVALTDDLVDLLADWQSGAPNTLIAGAGAGDGGSDGSPADAWLYRVAGPAAAQIVATLRSASLLYPPRPAGRLTAIEAAAKFATFTVARWVGWREELSPRRTGYREAIHWMSVPRLEEDRVRLETHPAIVFQRAVVLDSLLDGYAAGLEVPASVLAHEALLLLQDKRQDVGGGWSYLPGAADS